MTASTRIATLVLCCCVCGAASGDPPADAPGVVPQEGFLSSLKQAFKEDFDREIVRGHFDVGTAPDRRRFYCLVDPKNGRREEKAVTGELVKRTDGTTGIKTPAVSLYGCDSAEQRGILVTTGYALTGAAANAPAPAATPATTATTATTATMATAAPPAQNRPDVPGGAAARGDVSGIRLGMTVEEVRAALRSKRLADYYESADRLWAVGGEDTPVTSGRYMNEIAAWSPASDGGFESYTVLFTPVPGRERAMAIAHIRDYAAGGGPRESALNSALVRKYGGYRTAEDVPAAATWRVQIGGEIQTGDSCSRRELFESFAANRDPSAPVANPALKTTPDEFRYQLDHCGVDVVTADHTTANPSAPPAERIATHLTVSAYSPAIAFEGSTAAAGLMQAPERRSPAAAPPGSSPAAPAL